MAPKTCLIAFIVVVCFVLDMLSGAGGSIGNLKCIYYQKRTFNCTYTVSQHRDWNYTCSVRPGLKENYMMKQWVCTESTKPHMDFCQFKVKDNTCDGDGAWTNTSETGRCNYTCNPGGYCHSVKHIQLKIIDQYGNSTCITTDVIDKYLQPGPVRSLKIVNISDTSISVNWTKPKDYDNRNDSYNYTVLLITDKEGKNYTRKRSKRLTVTKRVKLKHRNWRWCHVTVTAAFRHGGHEGRPMSDNVTNPYSAVFQPIVGKESSPLIVATSLPIAGVLILILLACFLKTKTGCFEKIAITIPRLPAYLSTTPETPTETPPVPKLALHDKYDIPLRDSERGSMETNNDSGSYGDKEVSTNATCTTPLGDTSSERGYTDTSLKSGVSGGDDTWNSSEESGLSIYRQVAAQNDVLHDIGENVKVEHKSLRGNEVHLPTFNSLSETPIQTGNVLPTLAPHSGKSAGSYSAFSMDIPSNSVTDAAGLASTEDEDDSWNASGDSCVSAYRQVPNLEESEVPEEDGCDSYGVMEWR